jgi:hypothetical protein
MMTKSKAIDAGLLAGALAGLIMTIVMLLLAWLFGVATPLAIMGDRLSVFIPADTFLSLMGRMGGYNHMKQLGVATLITVGGLILAFIAFEHTIVLGFRFLASGRIEKGGYEFSPAIGRRALVLGGLEVVIAGGGAAFADPL